MNGIYVHIPYCIKKCGYCDFYSVCDFSSADKYTEAVCDKLSKVAELSDTLYIGGGTPSAIGGDRLAKIICCAKRVLTEDAEITVEVNPGDDVAALMPKLAACGVNRVSIGMQTHIDSELRLLTRRHTSSNVDLAVDAARNAGINNISLDVMLGIEGQTIDSLKQSLDYCIGKKINHISTYMLKIEKGTPFEKADFCPSDDLQADMYLFVSDYLTKHGYHQYEISNFSFKGYESKHNLKYWRGDSYIGIGPSAHSYYNGRRSYYSPSLADFLNTAQPIDDGQGGGFDERVMLGLRLTCGIDCELLLNEFPNCNNKIKHMLIEAERLAAYGLVTCSNSRICLTPKGFLVSNEIIGVLLD